MSTTPHPWTLTPQRFAVSEHTLTLPDGTELFYRAWLPEQPTQKTLVVFHRGHEHSGRVQDIVEALNIPDAAVFAWDARGHGRTPGDRGYAPSFAVLVQDVDGFIRHLAATHGRRLEDMVILAQSVGAVTVATWVHDYAPPIRALVLAAPALRIKLYVPWAIPGIRALLWLRRGRKTFIKSYVKAQMLTHDPEQARRYDADALIAKAIAANILIDLHDTSTRLMDDAAAIRVPTLVLAAGSDWVVKLGGPTPLLRTARFADQAVEGLSGDVPRSAARARPRVGAGRGPPVHPGSVRAGIAAAAAAGRRSIRLYRGRVRSADGTVVPALAAALGLCPAAVGDADRGPAQPRRGLGMPDRF